MKICKLGDRIDWQNRIGEKVRQRKINRRKARHDKLLVKFCAGMTNGKIWEVK
jgi:hypothetical protein